MSLDTDHAIFVREQYRRTPNISDAMVKARNSTAAELVIDTQLDEASATALATKVLADGNQPRVFEVTLEGAFDMSELVGGIPRRVLDDPQLATDGRALKLVSITNDHAKNIHVIRMRG